MYVYCSFIFIFIFISLQLISLGKILRLEIFSRVSNVIYACNFKLYYHLLEMQRELKLWMLPNVITLHTISFVIATFVFSWRSSTLGSATNQVYQALAQLLKLCDDVLLHGDQSSALDTENVTHIIGLVEEAVKNLVALANEKIANRQKPVVATASNR